MEPIASKPKLKEATETQVVNKTTQLTAVTDKTIEAQNKQKKFNYIIYGVGIFFSLLLLGLAIFMLVPTQDEKEAKAKAEAEKIAAAASVPEPTQVSPPPYLASFQANPNGWYFQPQPIDTLVEQKLQETLSKSSYNQNGQLTAPNGAVLAPNSPELFALMNSMRESSKAMLSQNYRTEPRGAYAQLYHRDPASGEYVEITDPNQVAQIENELSTFMNNQLADALNKVPPPPTVTNEPVANAEPKVIDMTDEQRQKYMSLIENQRDWNRRLQSENADLKKELAKQEKGVTNIIQKLEDSPTANQRLRATMLPKSTGLKVEAIMSGRAWVRDTKTNELYTLEVGSTVPNSELKVAELQEDTGMIMVTPRK